ncbi:MAG TPA: SGNH/GDSL hydrolase family protein [Thermoanaerobaculia bacterium]|nr:SGNH/GDSL hydrolase family protein [Thermoanaerobaculia bacterium]
MSTTRREVLLDPLAARLLLALGAVGLAGTVLCAAGWLQCVRRPAPLERIGAEQRQVLLADLLRQSPGAFVPAWFHPPVGYTLKPGRRIRAWGDDFVANELGYRTWPPQKRAGTFRVVFAGDSWTFGLGVRREESFPHQFELLAHRAVAGRRVEAWNLGLPGYNTLNELAALEFFFERLRPDLVVLCPTSNDRDSGGAVLPNGSLTRAGVQDDGLGADHSLVYRLRVLDSHQFRSRWRAAFAAVRRTEQRLRRQRVPLLLFFAATWPEPFAHRLVAEAGLAAPYVITPPELTGRSWRNPPPFRHGTPAANQLYGQMVYRGAAHLFGWPALAGADPRGAVPVYAAQEAATRASGVETLLRGETRRLPESYRPSPRAEVQCVGPMECATGLMGQATTVLVRRRPGATRLRVSVRRLAEAPSLYPLALSIEIPSPAGGSRRVVSVPADGPEVHSFALPLPGDVAAGAALDVVLRAERVAAAPQALAARSLLVAEIAQE